MEEQTMDDSEVNPMKTGLMFDPLGATMYPSAASPSRSPDHLARLAADIGVDVRDLVPAPRTERRWSFRRLLERFPHIPQRHLPSPT